MSSKVKKSKRPTRAVATQERPHDAGRDRWMWVYVSSLLVALIAAFEVYWPAIHGPFLLDDTYLPFMAPGIAGVPLKAWLHGVRPLLTFTYWLNYQQSGVESTFGYHLWSVLLHFFSSIFIFLAVRKVLSWSGEDEFRTRVLSFFAAGLFLL